MLATLSIRDVVLVDRLDLRFAPGLSTLTGETGAGKSILLDALGLALGGRADARLVRHGADRATVVAEFDLPPDHPAFTVLDEGGIERGEADGESLVIRRVLGADGRSRAFVNDQPVSVGLARRLGEALVEVHGQFENQRLLDPASHRRLLDAYGSLQPIVDATAAARRRWQETAHAAREAEAALADARRDEDYLRHAVEELRAMEPRPGEEAQLAERRSMLQNAEKLTEAMTAAAEAMVGGAGGRGAMDLIQDALRRLHRAAEKAGERLDPTIAALDRAADEVADAHGWLERAAADLDLDPRHLEQAEERLFALRALARKHGCTVDDLAALAEEMAGCLDALDNGADAVHRLEAEAEAARHAYRKTAEALSAARQEAAGRLDAAVATELAPLRLGGARFGTRIDRLDEADWAEHGIDRVTFEVAANPGVPPGPLNRVASGGELARLTLALKVVLAAADPVPTLVFDEVDAGVGGAVAAAVGERLARLAGDVQVLVVTHSPQVAARGAHHLRVSKTAGDTARTAVDVLDAGGRTEEIARMLAGARITEEARAAAASLLKGAA